MAEDKIKKQNEEQLQDEQLDDVTGGGRYHVMGNDVGPSL